jgi:hypothetical protein
MVVDPVLALRRIAAHGGIVFSAAWANELGCLVTRFRRRDGRSGTVSTRATTPEGAVLELGAEYAVRDGKLELDSPRDRVVRQPAGGGVGLGGSGGGMPRYVVRHLTLAQIDVTNEIAGEDERWFFSRADCERASRN